MIEGAKSQASLHFTLHVSTAYQNRDSNPDFHFRHFQGLIGLILSYHDSWVIAVAGNGSALGDWKLFGL
jgi:hypothetical protein